VTIVSKYSLKNAKGITFAGWILKMPALSMTVQ
jgi:hypothetical protein